MSEEQTSSTSNTEKQEPEQQVQANEKKTESHVRRLSHAEISQQFGSGNVARTRRLSHAEIATMFGGKARAEAEKKKAGTTKEEGKE